MPAAPSRAADRFLWGLVAVAAAAVTVVAIARGRSQKPPIERAQAPRISLPLLDGRGQAAIEKGRVTVVDFWATWCAPCRVSMPRVQKVWRDYRPRGVDLYSVDTDDPAADREAQVKEFLVKNGLEFPVVLDDGTASSAFSIAVLPTMLVLDRDARVVWKHGIALLRRVGAGHAAAVPGHHPLAGHVRERDHGAAGPRQRTEPREQPHQRVRRHADRRQVSGPARLQERLLHLRPVGERVDHDVDRLLPEILHQLRGESGDGEVAALHVPLVGAHVLGRVLEAIVGG